MFFKKINRCNPKTGNRENYYSLVESYRNALGKPSHRTIFSLGYEVDNLRTVTSTSEKRAIVVIDADRHKLKMHNIRSSWTLKYEYAPFIRKKSVVNKNELLKKGYVDLLNFSSG